MYAVRRSLAAWTGRERTNKTNNENCTRNGIAFAIYAVFLSLWLILVDQFCLHSLHSTLQHYFHFELKCSRQANFSIISLTLISSNLSLNKSERFALVSSWAPASSALQLNGQYCFDSFCRCGQFAYLDFPSGRRTQHGSMQSVKTRKSRGRARSLASLKCIDVSIMDEKFAFQFSDRLLFIERVRGISASAVRHVHRPLVLYMLR